MISRDWAIGQGAKIVHSRHSWTCDFNGSYAFPSRSTQAIATLLAPLGPGRAIFHHRALSKASECSNLQTVEHNATNISPTTVCNNKCLLYVVVRGGQAQHFFTAECLQQQVVAILGRPLRPRRKITYDRFEKHIIALVGGPLDSGDTHFHTNRFLKQMIALLGVRWGPGGTDFATERFQKQMVTQLGCRLVPERNIF